MILAAETVGFWKSFGDQLAPLLATLVVGLLTAGIGALPKLWSTLNAKAHIAKNEAADAVLQRILSVVELAVGNAAQTAVNTAKTATYAAPEERKAALEAIRKNVIAQIMADLSAQKLTEDAKAIFGIKEDAGELSAQIGVMVEAAIAKTKA